MNKFKQESHERASQNRARRAFELIKTETLLFIFEMSDCLAR